MLERSLAARKRVQMLFEKTANALGRRVCSRPPNRRLSLASRPQIVALKSKNKTANANSATLLGLYVPIGHRRKPVYGRQYLPF